MDAQARRRAARGALAALAALQLAACAGVAGRETPLDGRTPGQARLRAYNRPYEVRGRRYVPVDAPGYDATGTASWYGYESGRRTSNGERFTLEGLTAAHRTLPIPSLLQVTNLDTGARVVVRLNDRGPFVDGRLIDVSREAARRLGMLDRGTARVRVRYLGPADEWAPRQIARRASPPSAAVEPRAAPPPPNIDPLQLVATLPALAEPPQRAIAPAGPARVQAAAFSDAALARLAAARLAAVGAASVESPRPGAVLWRVVVAGAPGDGARMAAEAEALGFPGAHVLTD